MSDITKTPTLIHICLFFYLRSVLGYENAYDLMERRRSFNEPSRSRYFETTEQFFNRYNNGDRFSSGNRRPGGFSSFRPEGFDRRVSTFGNGYDNLGNGSPDRSFGDSGRFDSLRDTDRFSSFNNGGNYDSIRDSDRYRGPSYNRRFQGSTLSLDRPYRKAYTKRYNSDYPDFYERDYFVKPKIEEKIIDTERKNIDKAYETASGQKGLAGVSKVDSLVALNEDNKQKKVNTGFKNNEEGSHTDATNKENFGESARFDKNGENKSTVRTNKVVKKGHTTKGFASHHHKDETGNTTTFFDESIDQGGQTDFRDIADEFGTRKTSEQFSGNQDGKFRKETVGQSGNFGSGYLHDNKKYEKDILSNDKHFDKEERFGGDGENAEADIRRNSHHFKGGHFGLSDPGMHYERFY